MRKGKDPIGLEAEAIRQIAARLRTRREEIEQAVLARVYAISDPSLVSDPEYSEGLRSAVTVALELALTAAGGSERHPPPIPPALLVQARVAARSGVDLDTVLRRYMAGNALLGDFVIEAAESQGALRGPVLRRLMRTQASVFDRLLAAVTDEHRRELEDCHAGDEKHQTELVQKLLEGERIDTAALAYELESTHVGVVAKGPEAAGLIRGLGRTLDYRVLLVDRGGGTLWAWLGGRRGIDLEEVRDLASARCPPEVSLAIGEPGEGVEGWRLSHRQACAALPIAMRGSDTVRYADVALIASMFQDDLLAISLRRLYLDPIADGGGGSVLQETLRAYLAAERNVSSAAAVLGVNRHTVSNRLRMVEERLGRPLSSCMADIDAAIRLADLLGVHSAAGFAARLK